MELNALTPSKNNGRGAGPPATIPLTPTIRLSEPPTPHHVDYNEPATISEGINNPAFVGDQEPLFSKSFVPRDKGIISTDEFVEDNASVFSASLEQSNSLNLSTESSTGGPQHLNGINRTRHNTMSLSDMLMPPNFKKSQKRHSLPTNGVSVAGSNGQTISNENGSTSFLGSSCASIMSQVSSPMKGLSSPWAKWFQRKSSDGSVISSVSDGSLLVTDDIGILARGTLTASESGIHYQTVLKISTSLLIRRNVVVIHHNIFFPIHFASCEPADDSSARSKRLQDLVKSVARKVKKNKKNKVGPAMASSPNLLAPPEPPGRPVPKGKTAGNIRKRLDSFAPSSILDQHETARLRGLSMKKWGWKSFKIRAIDPTGNFWLAWMGLVSLAFIYNAVVIFLRGIFSYVQGGNDTASIIEGSTNVQPAWLFFDYTCDFIYIMDIYLGSHLGYFAAGQVVRDLSLTRKNYFTSKRFKYDLFSLLPLDLFYFLINGVQPLLRFPRLLKFHVYVEFSSKFENKIRMAFIFRTVRMVGYLLYMIHLNTCCYFAMSRLSGVNSTAWVYDGIGDPYVRCLYRAAKTLITIGNLPAPTTTPEIIFMTIDFMIGIFVFATIIGQMRDIVGSASATKNNFRKRMDSTISILKNRGIPDNVQKRVNLWFMNSLDRGELLDEQTVLQAMPIKMQTDMAIHVHMDTLSKVSLFQDCDKMLLRDLVLQLRPVLFLPGDYICKKGEVGKEMYIIKNGMVQVLGGDDGKKVLATLHAGSVFGEISLLSLGAGNRRTADVHSPGYSDLFVLDKKVLHEVIVSYPDAQEVLKKKAKEILKQNESSDSLKKKRRGKSLIAESILNKNPSNSPSKFFKAVLEIARSKHISATILRGSFDSKTDDEEATFFHYSSSDISDDEFLPREKRSFRKRKERHGKFDVDGMI
ncbi:hypothetical protein BSL78_23972 [Apostichopus japonicus]|uniref:Cyclic nucleotide-binding domain-containing protein n=1 Tax=Stichopus japonicus TaxID=307972 RepID=A0A2G8JTW0_STIJA|nr:hypothetical protein BSL78_23972 [Apostichopus japonicus]